MERTHRRVTRSFFWYCKQLWCRTWLLPPALLAASGSCLLCKKLGSALTAARLDLVLALPACGSCLVVCLVVSWEMKNGGLWRRVFVEVIYMPVFDYGMLHADHTDVTSVYTVQTVESCSFPECLHCQICALQCSRENWKESLLCVVSRELIFVCVCWKIESAFIDIGCHCSMMLYLRPLES